MGYKKGRFRFEHKQIDFPEWEDNYFLDNVQENFPRLKAIYDGDVSFVSSDYPTLINMAEQLYKGVCKELLKIHTDRYKRDDKSYTAGHRFNMFADIINRYIRLSPTKEGFEAIKRNIEKMENSYNATRFQRKATFDEFQSDYRRFESQLSRMMDGLSREYEMADRAEEEDLQNY